MKIYLLIMFYLIAININGQISSCTPTIFPAEIFSPNSINTGTVNVDWMNIQYLCGPNTVLYDTTDESMGRQVYIDNFSTLFLKVNSPAFQHIWVKNNCTLNILDGPSIVFIHVELGAIINQPVGPHSYSAYIDTCSTIVYPNINCTTGLPENNAENHFIISPNPSTGEFSIKSNDEIKKIEVINTSGELLFVKFIHEINPKLNLGTFNSGIYFVKIYLNNNLYSVKKIVLE